MTPTRSIIHRVVAQHGPTVLCRDGSGWRSPTGAKQLAAGIGSQATAGPSIDVLSDLAIYGLVLPLAELRPGTLLGWPGTPFAGKELRAPDSARRDTPPHGPVALVQWKPIAEPLDRWRYAVSSMARCLAASAAMPIVHHELLSVAVNFDALPAGDTFLALGRPDPSAFLWAWSVRVRDAVGVNIELLRERRRLALGLPARHDPAALEEAIERRFLLPVAQHLLDAVSMTPLRRLRVIASADAALLRATSQVVTVPVGRYLSDDPAGENIFVLSGQRVRVTSTPGRLLRYTGRRLMSLAYRVQQAPRRSDAVNPPEWGAPMLAALQLDYLETHR